MKTIVCLASGPSLTVEDCRLIQQAGVHTIAVNSTWQRAPWAHEIFAADIAWWQTYHHRIDAAARRWTSHPVAAKKFGLRQVKSPLTGTFNSGQRAILLACALGAERILLLGYDCALTHGAHWHGPHPIGLGNPSEKSLGLWQAEFRRLRAFLPQHTIINCSRHTALTVFPTGDVQEALATPHD